MTYPDLIQLLLTQFNNNDEMMFLDIGADNIDFFFGAEQ